MTRDGKVGVLFVCLGNICRSPVAEGVFRHVVEREGLGDRFDIDSAGTSSYHAGDPPDERTSAVARRRGIELEHAARQITSDDLERFDWVLAMDRENLGKIERLAAASGGGAEVALFRSFEDGAEEGAEVPDPYFGGDRGFEDVHDMVERAAEGLLRHIREEHGF